MIPKKPKDPDESQNPRVAVWCLHDSETSLPIAARRMLSGLPADAIVWRGWGLSEEPPLELNIDLWLVLCSGPPASPPAWRFSREGKWVIYPGSAEKWGVDTRESVEEWNPAAVVSDLLPDEMASSARIGWKSKQELVWMPVWDDQWQLDGDNAWVVVGKECKGWMCETLGSILVDRLEADQIQEDEIWERSNTIVTDRQSSPVILLGVDPIICGLLMRKAAQHGFPVFSLELDSKRWVFRSILLGFDSRSSGKLTGVGSMGTRLSPLIRTMLRQIYQPEASRVVPVLDWSWSAWLIALTRPDSDHGDVLNASAWIMRYACQSEEMGDPDLGAVENWFALAEPELWKEVPTEFRIREALTVIGLLKQFELHELGTAKGCRILARLCGLIGDAHGAEHALSRFAGLNDGQTGALAGMVALALWRRGRVEEARKILREWADSPAQTAMACLVLAVASEILEIRETLDLNLTELWACYPSYFRADENDQRWGLAALIGSISRSSRSTQPMLTRASEHPLTNGRWISVCNGSISETHEIDPRWGELFDELPTC